MSENVALEAAVPGLFGLHWFCQGFQGSLSGKSEFYFQLISHLKTIK
jgi:hypothetical protein